VKERENNMSKMSETLAAAASGYNAMVKRMDAVDVVAGGYASDRGMRQTYDRVAGEVSKAKDALDTVLKQCTAEDVSWARAMNPTLDDAIYYAEKRIGLRS
jgi:hypothetical protein